MRPPTPLYSTVELWLLNGEYPDTRASALRTLYSRVVRFAGVSRNTYSRNVVESQVSHVISRSYPAALTPDPSTGSQSGSAAPVQPQVPQRCCALPLVAVSMLPTGLCHVPSPLVPGPIPRPGDQHARNVGHVLDFVTTLSSFYSAHYSATRRMVRRRQSCFLSPSARRCSGPWVASRCHSVPKWIAYGPGAPSG